MMMQGHPLRMPLFSIIMDYKYHMIYNPFQLFHPWYRKTLAYSYLSFYLLRYIQDDEKHMYLYLKYIQN